MLKIKKQDFDAAVLFSVLTGKASLVRLFFLALLFIVVVVVKVGSTLGRRRGRRAASSSSLVVPPIPFAIPANTDILDTFICNEKNLDFLFDSLLVPIPLGIPVVS